MNSVKDQCSQVTYQAISPDGFHRGLGVVFGIAPVFWMLLLIGYATYKALSKSGPKSRVALRVLRILTIVSCVVVVALLSLQSNPVGFASMSVT